MIPLPCDNMSDVVNVGTAPFLTNVSSNAYYGYQPQWPVESKQDPISSTARRAAKNTNPKMEMQLIDDWNMQIENDGTLQVSRKRSRCSDQSEELKKRRQNYQEFNSANGMY